jgi:N-acetylglucosaminylphosphatidylinositol deacetylase
MLRFLTIRMSPCLFRDADDRRLQDGMNNHWASSHVSHVLDHHLRSFPASIVGHLSVSRNNTADRQIITFDPIGITHHPNHIALAHGCSFGPRTTTGQCYALQSPSILTKFTGPAWAIWYNIINRYSPSDSWQVQEKIKRRYTIVNTPKGWLTGAVAMSEHRSQLVWFRYLYFIASRLVWYNELEELLEHG